MSVNIERLAIDAVAGNDEDIGLDALKRLKTELWVLNIALNNDHSPLDRRDAASAISQMIYRIELAVALRSAEMAEAAE